MLELGKKFDGISASAQFVPLLFVFVKSIFVISYIATDIYTIFLSPDSGLKDNIQMFYIFLYTVIYLDVLATLYTVVYFFCFY